MRNSELNRLLDKMQILFNTKEKNDKLDLIAT